MNLFYNLLFLLLFFNTANADYFRMVDMLDPTKKHIEKELSVVELNTTAGEIDYLSDIQTILDKRCVVCHSCYNSPCQLKLTSYEGLARGATKKLVYDGTRLRAVKPTRLFVDALTDAQWRTKGFNSVIDKTDADKSNSTLMQMLKLKKDNPKISGVYNSDSDLECVSDSYEMDDYAIFKSHKGMPYGFPDISYEEFEKISAWMYQGQKGYTPKQEKEIKEISSKVKKIVTDFESFLNADDAKHIMSARYIYEHLFLSHISFEDSPSEFYELVRSYTPSPAPIEIVKTVLPYENAGKKFYYRLKRIHSSIVHKTHIVYYMSKDKLKRFNELFIKPSWSEAPHVMPYEKRMNPFVTYSQIPAASRYQFMLDDAEYFVRTFIRGPVCKGQIALNVIQDHFWVMFANIKSDLSVQKRDFMVSQYENLQTPIVLGEDAPIYDTLTNEYINRANRYFDAKVKLYQKERPSGFNMSDIWQGDNNESAPVLTIHRHFDSASVIKGALGDMPRTLWVIDYSLFERIYYTLVAGFDVFGNVSHQTNIRRYMDVLRMEGEMNFIAFMPENKRVDILKSWYIGDNSFSYVKEKFYKVPSQIRYHTNTPVQEFIQKVVDEHILKSTNIHFDNVNFIYLGEKIPEFPKKISTEKELYQALKSLVQPGSGFIRYVNGYDANVIFVKFKNIPRYEDKFVTLIINRWHDNVNAMFDEKSRLNPAKDTLEIYDGSLSSYPNFFFVVDFKDIEDFLKMLMYFKPNIENFDKVKKYGISRENKKFWEVYDWFQEEFLKKEPIEGGIYDLTKYYSKPVEIDYDILIQDKH